MHVRGVLHAMTDEFSSMTYEYLSVWSSEYDNTTKGNGAVASVFTG